MGRVLTEHYENKISRLIRLGVFANRGEAVRAGLRELENRFLRSDYLNPPPLPKGGLTRAYRRQSGEE